MVSGKVKGCCNHGIDGKVSALISHGVKNAPCNETFYILFQSTVGYDCLLIPAPTNLAIAGGFGGFCGGLGLVTEDGAMPLNDATKLKTVCCKLLSSTDYKMRNKFLKI